MRVASAHGLSHQTTACRTHFYVGRQCSWILTSVSACRPTSHSIMTITGGIRKEGGMVIFFKKLPWSCALGLLGFVPWFVCKNMKICHEENRRISPVGHSFHWHLCSFSRSWCQMFFQNFNIFFWKFDVFVAKSISFNLMWLEQILVWPGNECFAWHQSTLMEIK